MLNYRSIKRSANKAVTGKRNNIYSEKHNKNSFMWVFIRMPEAACFPADGRIFKGEQAKIPDCIMRTMGFLSLLQMNFRLK